jgi:hypothetical protein
MLYLCEDVRVASCSSHILYSYNLTLGFISSVYPDSVNGQRHSTDSSSPSFRPIPSSFVTSLHSGMILDFKVPTPSQPRSQISVHYQFFLFLFSFPPWMTMMSSLFFRFSDAMLSTESLSCKGAMICPVCFITSGLVISRNADSVFVSRPSDARIDCS